MRELVSRADAPCSKLFRIVLGQFLSDLKHKLESNEQDLLRFFTKNSYLLTEIDQRLTEDLHKIYILIFLQFYKLNGKCLSKRTIRGFYRDITVYRQFLNRLDIENKDHLVKFLDDNLSIDKASTNPTKTKNLQKEIVEILKSYNIGFEDPENIRKKCISVLEKLITELDVKGHQTALSQTKETNFEGKRHQTALSQTKETNFEGKRHQTALSQTKETNFEGKRHQMTLSQTKETNFEEKGHQTALLQSSHTPSNMPGSKISFSEENMKFLHDKMTHNIEQLILSHDKPLYEQQELFTHIILNLNQLKVNDKTDRYIFKNILKNELHIELKKCIEKQFDVILGNFKIEKRTNNTMIDHNFIEKYQEYTNTISDPSNSLKFFREHALARTNGEFDKLVPKRFKAKISDIRSKLRNEMLNIDYKKTKPTIFGSKNIYNLSKNLNEISHNTLNSCLSCFETNFGLKDEAFDALRVLFYLEPYKSLTKIIPLLLDADITLSYLKLLQEVLAFKITEPNLPRSLIRRLSEKILYFNLDIELIREQIVTREQFVDNQRLQSKIQEIEEQKLLILSSIIEKYHYNDNYIKKYEFQDIISRNERIDSYVDSAKRKIAVKNRHDQQEIFNILQSLDEHDIDKRNVNVLVHKIVKSDLLNWKSYDGDEKVRFLTVCLEHSQRGFLNEDLKPETIRTALESKEVSTSNLISFMSAILQHGYRHFTVFRAIFFKCIDIIDRSNLELKNIVQIQRSTATSLEIQSIEEMIFETYRLLKAFKHKLTGKFYLFTGEIFDIFESNVKWGENERKIIRKVFFTSSENDSDQISSNR